VSEERPVVVEGGGISIRLPVFDGPFDLLLHLIRTEELDIFDIPIARLTASYLQVLEEMRRLDIEPASEFLVMAATLMQIKSRMLLPRPPSLDDVEGATLEDDPREELVRRLLEYQRFQEVARGLDQLPYLGRDFFLRVAGLDRPPDEEEDAPPYSDVFRLGDAFRHLLEKRRFEAPHDVFVERVTIAERIAQIAEQLARDARTTFAALCGGARYREELITTFLALLEMTRLKLIRTFQDDRLGPLYVEARVGAIGRLGEEAAGMLDEA
jgi:segregation and condensation protein A